MKEFMIDKFGMFMFGSKVWGQLQGSAKVADVPKLSGKEKLESAKGHAVNIGIELIGYMLNLGIELAVALLRVRLSK